MTYEKWDPEIVKEEEGADGDSHDQTNLAGQIGSKFAFCLEFKILMYAIL